MQDHLFSRSLDHCLLAIFPCSPESALSTKHREKRIPVFDYVQLFLQFFCQLMALIVDAFDQNKIWKSLDKATISLVWGISHPCQFITVDGFCKTQTMKTSVTLTSVGQAHQLTITADSICKTERWRYHSLFLITALLRIPAIITSNLCNWNFAWWWALKQSYSFHTCATALHLKVPLMDSETQP